MIAHKNAPILKHAEDIRSTVEYRSVTVNKTPKIGGPMQTAIALTKIKSPKVEVNC